VNRSVVTATGFAVAGLAMLIALGVWQLERKAWKENLIATLTARLSAPPQALPPSPAQPNDEFRRVKLRGSFADGSALVFTSGSALRRDVSGPGYWVMSPLRVADGGTVVVNRGFVADKNNIPPPPSGEVTLTGALRWPEEGGMFTPADEPSKNLWFRRAPAAIAAAKGWGQNGESVAPFYVEQETPQRAGAPRAGPLVVHQRNAHLQYSLTWFAHAAGLAAVYGIWLFGRLRHS
jgi:surfeit locus 1 family protein